MSRRALLLQAWGWGCPGLRPRRLAYLKSDGWSSKRLNSCQGTDHAGNSYYSLDQNKVYFKQHWPARNRSNQGQWQKL